MHAIFTDPHRTQNKKGVMGSVLGTDPSFIQVFCFIFNLPSFDSLKRCILGRLSIIYYAVESDVMAAGEVQCKMQVRCDWRIINCG